MTPSRFFPDPKLVSYTREGLRPLQTTTGPILRQATTRAIKRSPFQASFATAFRPAQSSSRMTGLQWRPRLPNHRLSCAPSISIRITRALVFRANQCAPGFS